MGGSGEGPRRDGRTVPRVSTPTSADAVHDLLGEVLDLLVKVEEYVDGRADADFDGESYTANEAMQIMSRLNDNEGWDDGGRGLISRVRLMWQASKP